MNDAITELPDWLGYFVLALGMATWLIGGNVVLNSSFKRQGKVLRLRTWMVQQWDVSLNLRETMMVFALMLVGGAVSLVGLMIVVE